MRRYRTTVRMATNVGPDGVSLFTSDGVPRSIVGDADITVGVDDNHHLSVSVSSTQVDLLNGMMNSATWTPDSPTPSLPFNDTTQPTVPLSSGTSLLVTQPNSTLTLTVSGTTPVGFQWFVINTHSESNLTLLAGVGATMYGFGVIAPLHGALVRLFAANQFFVLETPSSMASDVAKLTTTVNGTPVTEPAVSTSIVLHTYASGTTIVKTNASSTVVLTPDAATVGSFWYVVNDCLTTAIIESPTGTVYGGMTIPSLRAALVRQCVLGTFVVIGTPVDPSANVDQLMSEVFGASVPTNTGVLQLPSTDAPAGSTTIMNGPCGEVRLHSLSTGIGQSWFVVNATPREILVFGVADGSVPAPEIHGAAYIPVGRLASIRQYALSAFTVMLSHPDDTPPQPISYFRTEVYTPDTATVHVPRHPVDASPVLKNGALITITVPNTVVNLWQETSLDVGGFVFHFQNNSTTTIVFTSGTGTTGGATVNGLASYTLAVGGRVTVGILDGTRQMRADATPLHLPYPTGVPTDSYRAGTGLLLMNNNQVVNLNATTAAGFVVPTGSAVERAFCLRNVTNTTATLVAGAGVTITGTLTISPFRTAYVRNTENGAWLVTVPVVHLPTPSLTEDPIPNGANLDITEPGSQIRIYANTRTVGYWWLVNNASGTDISITPTLSGTNVAAPVLTGASRIVPSGMTGVLRQIEAGRYTLFVPVVYRPVALVTTNFQILDGAFEDKLAVLKMTTPDANGAYGVVLGTSNSLSDGAVIEILNHCTAAVQMTANTGVILSRLDKTSIASGSAVLVRYVAGTGFLVIGDLI